MLKYHEEFSVSGLNEKNVNMWLSYAVCYFIFTVVQDRVIAYWFPDKLGLAFGAIVSVIRCGNVLNFFITSNIAKIYGVPMALWTGKQEIHYFFFYFA